MDIRATLECIKTEIKGKTDAFSKYLNTYTVEIAEIIQQLKSEYPLATYKVRKDLSYSRKFLLSLKLIAVKVFRQSFKDSQPQFYPDAKFIFIVEYISHYKEFISLHKKMQEHDIPHVTFFINEATYKKYSQEIGNCILVDTNTAISYRLKVLLYFLQINFKLLTSKFIRGIAKNTNLLKTYTELFYLNSRTLFDNLLLVKNFERQVKSYPRIPVIFFKSEGYRTRALILAAQSLSHKTVSIQHGSIFAEGKNFNLPTDLYIVWADIFKNNLIASGTNCDIEALGRPSFDEVFFQRSGIAKRNMDKNNLKLIFLPNSGSSQTPYSEVLFALNICLDAAQHLPEIELFIKPHPGDKTDRILSRINELPSKSNIHYISGNSKMVYHDYDIIVTMNSTSGVEAAVFEKPVILVASDIKMVTVKDYLEEGIALFASSTKEFTSALNKILSDYDMYRENTKCFTNKYMFNQGVACDAIINRILALNE